MDFCGKNRLFPEIDIFSAVTNNQYQNIIIITIIIIIIIIIIIYYYYFMPWISFKIYFKLNAEVLQGNTAVLLIFRSLKRVITIGRNFHRTVTQQLC